MLSEIKIFSELTKKDLEELESLCTTHDYKKRSVVFSEGEASEWFYILTKGKIKITKLSQEGKEIILEIIQPTDFFGAIAVVRGFPYPANAVALEDCEILKMPKAAFSKILAKYPMISTQMLTNLIDRVRTSHENLKSIALEKVDSRIAFALIKLSENHGKPHKDGLLVDMKITKQELADMVGTTVETTIRVMSKFRKSGYIDEHEGKIIIKKMNMLKDFTA